MELAYTVTALYYDVDTTKKAQENFINVVQKKCIPDNIIELSDKDGKNLIDILLELDFVKSKGEAKRLFAGGAVKLDGEKITDITYKLDFSNKNEIILQSGKRNFAKLLK